VRFLKTDAENIVRGVYTGKTPPDDEFTYVAVPDDFLRGQDSSFPTHIDGGPLRWSWDGDNLVEIPDPRQLVRIVQTPNPGLVGTELTIRLELLNAQGTIRTGVSRKDVVISFRNPDRRERRGRLDVVSGIATRTFIPGESGDITLVSDRTNVRFIGDNPIVVEEDW
jgi:hypothetical protein